MPRPPAFVALGGGGDQDDEELDRQNSKHNLLNKTYNFDNDEDEDFEGQDEADRIIHSPTTTTAGGLGRGRVASFEFDQYAIPLSLSLVNKYGDLDDLGKSIGLLNGLALIIGCVVGSGIFASPGPILTYTQSPGAALLVWLIAGLLAATGALCYAELGTMMPSSGGEHPYLLKAYDSSLPAFLFSWTGITVTRPGAIAIICIIFAEYICRLIYFGQSFDASDHIILIRIIASLCILCLTSINALSTRLGAAVQNILTLLKLISLLVIGIVGISYMVSSSKGTNTTTTAGTPNGGGQVQIAKAHNFDGDVFSNSSSNPGNYALALFSALFAYDGWNNLNLVTGELKDPAKNLPRAIVIGTSIVVISYLLANFAYYAVLPADLIGSSHSIAMDFGTAVFGSVGGVLIPLAVVGSTFGAANATVFSSARVVYVSAKHGHAPRMLGDVHSRFHTPLNAIVFQGILSIIFVSIGTFNSLVNLFSMITWTFYLLAVFGLILLRVKEPYLERPYKVWMVAPIVFCLVSICLIGFSIMEAPTEACGAMLFLCSGVPAWWLAVKRGISFDDLGSRISGAWNRLRGQPQTPHWEYRLDEVALAELEMDF